MSFLDLIKGAIDYVLGRAKWYGFYLYEVQSDDGTHVTLRRVGEAGGHPDHLPNVEKRYGFHGVTCVGLEKQLVLVGFEGGNPARPYGAFYGKDNPKTTLIDADTWIQIGTAGSGGHSSGGGSGDTDKKVYVGSTDRLAVARRTDPVACGNLKIVGGPGGVTFTVTAQDGGVQVLGVLAGTALAFSPDPSTGGIGGIQGSITGGSSFFFSQ